MKQADDSLFKVDRTITLEAHPCLVVLGVNFRSLSAAHTFYDVWVRLLQ